MTLDVRSTVKSTVVWIRASNTGLVGSLGMNGRAGVMSCLFNVSQQVSSGPGVLRSCQRIELIPITDHVKCRKLMPLL